MDKHIHTPITEEITADLKAGDYVYGIQRLMDPEMASDYAFIGYILKNGAEVNSGSVPVDELGVSAPDDKTVVMTNCQDNLSDNLSCIIPK